MSPGSDTPADTNQARPEWSGHLSPYSVEILTPEGDSLCGWEGLRDPHSFLHVVAQGTLYTEHLILALLVSKDVTCLLLMSRPLDDVCHGNLNGRELEPPSLG